MDTVDPAVLRSICAAALPVLRSAIAQQPTKGQVEVNFQNTDHYADSFAWANRKKSGLLGFGGAVDAGTPIHTISIMITLRPGVLQPNWVGYSVDIDDPVNNPTVSLYRVWPEAGGELDADITQLPSLVPHIIALFQTPLTTDGKAPERQAPEGMF